MRNYFYLFYLSHLATDLFTFTFIICLNDFVNPDKSSLQCIKTNKID